MKARPMTDKDVRERIADANREPWSGKVFPDEATALVKDVLRSLRDAPPSTPEAIKAITAAALEVFE